MDVVETMAFDLYTYTSISHSPGSYSPGPSSSLSPESDNDHGDNYNYNYEDNDYYGYENYDEYSKKLQRLHGTVSSTVSFLRRLLHSFNSDIQSLTYVSEQTINQLWLAKVSSFTTTQDPGSGSPSGNGIGRCPWVSKIRAFFHHHQARYNNYNKSIYIYDSKKTREHLTELETHLEQAISTPWPPKGTTYTPDSVVYSDLSLDILYDRLLLLMEYFPVSMEYKGMNRLVVELELVQITMDRFLFLFSSL